MTEDGPQWDLDDLLAQVDDILGQPEVHEGSTSQIMLAAMGGYLQGEAARMGGATFGK